jgi:hypothetical protein
VSLLVLDTAVVLDLHRGELLQAAFGLDHAFLLPDLSFEDELDDATLGEYLRRLRLNVTSLEARELERAQALSLSQGALSLFECCSLVCAGRPGYELVTDGAALRARACEDGVKCWGILDLTDEIHAENLAAPGILLRGLLLVHRCRPYRLDEDGVQRRLAQWAALASPRDSAPASALLPKAREGGR